jgi:hypothetical protein
MYPVKYEMVSYIPEDDILHNHGREHFKSYILWFNCGQRVRLTTSAPSVSRLSRIYVSLDVSEECGLPGIGCTFHTAFYRRRHSYDNYSSPTPYSK